MAQFRFTDYLLGFLIKGLREEDVKDADAQTNETIEHPSFSTNIFDGCESEPEPAHWFWFCTVIAIFCFGVAVSYYIIHNF